MPRPLTGSWKKRADGAWDVSVPKRRGATSRRTEHFYDRVAGERWVHDVRQAFADGRDAPDPCTRRLVVPDNVAPNAQPTLTPLDTVFEEWHTERYIELRNAGDGRAEAVQQHYELHIKQTFAAMGVDCIEQLQRKHVKALVRHLAGWDVDDKNLWLDGEQPDVPRGKSGTPGLLHDTARGVLATLDMLIEYAIALDYISKNPIGKITAKSPDDQAERKHKQHRLPIRFCVALAARLPVPVQVAMWLLRLVGPRSHEVLDLRVRDVVEKQGWTVLRFPPGKTPAAERDIPVGKHVASMLWRFIAAVHGDVEDRDPDAWLIPRPSGRDGAGYTWLRNLLLEESEHLDLRALSDSMDPLSMDDIKTHGFRKSLITELQNRPDVTKATQQRYVGHKPGTATLDVSYTLSGLVEEFGLIATLVDQWLDEAGVTDLCIPTSEPFVPWRENHMYDDRNLIDQRLRDAGWLVDPVGGDGEIVRTVEEAAERLGESPRTVRRRLLEGDIPGTKHPSHGWLIREGDLDAYVSGDLDTTAKTLDELAAEHGLGYHEAYKILLRLDPGLSDGSGRQLVVTDRHAELLRDELGRLQALHQRSMPVSEAARTLRKSVSALNRTWIPNGLLQLDPETDATGQRFVTRESVQRQLSEDGGHDAMTMTEAADELDVTVDLLRQLIQAGELVRTRIGRKSGVTTKSVRSYQQCS